MDPITQVRIRGLVGDIVAALWLYSVSVAVVAAVVLFFFGGCIAGMLR